MSEAQKGPKVTRQEDVTIVDFQDYTVLDPAAAEDLSARLYELADREGKGEIILDMSAVRFLASQMIGVLVALHKKIGALGGRLMICGLAANIYRVFQLSRLDQVLLFAPTVELGKAALAGSTVGAPTSSPLPAPAPVSRLAGTIRRQLSILFAGALVLAPLAITAWVIWSLGAWVDDLGRRALTAVGAGYKVYRGTGAIIVLAVIYLVGLLTHLRLLRALFNLLESLVTRVPGVKTIYESVRDLMKLFGGGSAQMGRVVQYRVPGTDMAMLGILTNETPFGVTQKGPGRKVAVYTPFSYMLGGVTVFVSPDNIVEVDMSVEQCMKLCATAHIGSSTLNPRPRNEPKRPNAD